MARLRHHAVESPERAARAAQPGWPCHGHRLWRTAGVFGRLALAGVPRRLLRGAGSEAPQGKKATAQDLWLARAVNRQDDDGGRRRVIFLQPRRRTPRVAPLRTGIARGRGRAAAGGGGRCAQARHDGRPARVDYGARLHVWLGLGASLAGWRDAARNGHHGGRRCRKRRAVIRYFDQPPACARFLVVHLLRADLAQGFCGARRASLVRV